MTNIKINIPKKSIITINSIKKAALGYKPFSLPPNPPLVSCLQVCF
jgi:hypothetical protein